MTPGALYLWQDRHGRFSGLRAAVLLALVLPGAVALFDAAAGHLGPRPLNEAIHRTGLWAVRFIMISLAVTPIRRVARWPDLIGVRRMIGVAACLYAVVHLGLYCADQSFDLGQVFSEIIRRLYLTIGAAALIGLAALAVTSSDGMIRRMGGKAWRALHRLVYPIALLAIVHYFMQSKLNVTEPTVVAGLLGWLLLYRALTDWFAKAEPSPALLLGLGIAAGLATALGEAFGLFLVYHAPMLRVLMADFSLRIGPRPCWIVLAAGLAVALVALLRPRRVVKATPAQ